MTTHFGTTQSIPLHTGDNSAKIYLGETLIYGGEQSLVWTLEYRRNGETVTIIPITELGLTQYAYQENDQNVFSVDTLSEDGSSFYFTAYVYVNNRSYSSGSPVNLGDWEERKYHTVRVNQVDYFSDDFYVTYEGKGKIVVDRTDHVTVPVYLRKSTGKAWLSAGTYQYENLDTSTISSGAFEGQEIDMAYLNPDANLEGEYNLYLAGYSQSGTLKGAYTLSGDGQDPICKLLYKTGHSMPARVQPL